MDRNLKQKRREKRVDRNLIFLGFLGRERERGRGGCGGGELFPAQSMGLGRILANRNVFRCLDSRV